MNYFLGFALKLFAGMLAMITVSLITVFKELWSMIFSVFYPYVPCTIDLRPRSLRNFHLMTLSDGFV